MKDLKEMDVVYEEVTAKDGFDYFIDHILVAGKPLTREQKERFKKQHAEYEKLPKGQRTIFGKRRR